MFRIIKSTWAEYGTIRYVEAACNSEDEKPTVGFATGSTCSEADTGKVYMYDEADQQWHVFAG